MDLEFTVPQPPLLPQAHLLAAEINSGNYDLLLAVVPHLTAEATAALAALMYVADRRHLDADLEVAA